MHNFIPRAQIEKRWVISEINISWILFSSVAESKQACANTITKSQFAFVFNFYIKLWPLNKSTKISHGGQQALYSSGLERNDAQAVLEKSLSYYNSAIAKF